MEEDPPMIFDDTDLDLVGTREINAYNSIKDRVYLHTKAYDPALLSKTGIQEDFLRIWQVIGWEEFAEVSEPGSRFLTIQFLCTLKASKNDVTFRFFRKEYRYTWKEFSVLLGFHERCAVDLENATSSFNRPGFWKDIAGNRDCSQPRTNDIHNPTLRLMHKWLAMTVFPREDIRPVRVDELRILYAMVHKIRVSPVRCMIKQWLEQFKLKGAIECTSLITRIATKVGALDSVSTVYIMEPRVLVDEDYLVQGHILKHDPLGNLIFFFPGYTNEIRLPNPDLHLYNCRHLTIPLEEIERRSVSTRMTRSRSRRAARDVPPEQPPVYEHQEEHSPAGFASSWDRVQPAYEAGSSSWHSGNTEAWQQGHWTPPGSYTADEGGIEALTQRVGELEMRTQYISDTLDHHVRDTHAWQQGASTRFTNIDTALQRNYDNMSAYFNYMGFNPNQAP